MQLHDREVFASDALKEAQRVRKTLVKGYMEYLEDWDSIINFTLGKYISSGKVTTLDEVGRLTNVVIRNTAKRAFDRQRTRPTVQLFDTPFKPQSGCPDIQTVIDNWIAQSGLSERQLQVIQYKLKRGPKPLNRQGQPMSRSLVQHHYQRALRKLQAVAKIDPLETS